VFQDLTDFMFAVSFHGYMHSTINCV